MEEGHHRLAERHRLDREQPVPARVQLVEDDVGLLVALAGLGVVEPFDDLELDAELVAGAHELLGPLAGAARGRMDEERPLVARRRHRSKRGQVDARRDHFCVGNPADRVVGADDPRVCAASVSELVRALAADVRAEEVEDALAAGRAQDRELEHAAGRV